MPRERLKFRLTLRQLHEMGVVAAECMCDLAVYTVYLCGVALGVRSMKALAIKDLFTFVRVVDLC